MTDGSSNEGAPQQSSILSRRGVLGIDSVMNRLSELGNPKPVTNSSEEKPVNTGPTISRRTFNKAAGITAVAAGLDPEKTIEELDKASETFLPSIHAADQSKNPEGAGSPEIPEETEFISVNEETLTLIIDESGTQHWERVTPGEQFTIVKDSKPSVLDLGESMNGEARRMFCGYKTKEGKYIPAQKSTKTLGSSLPKFDRLDTDERMEITALHDVRILEIGKLHDDITFARPVQVGEKYEIKKGEVVSGLARETGPNKDKLIFLKDPAGLSTFAVPVESLIDPKTKVSRGDPGIYAVNTETFLFQNPNVLESDNFADKFDEAYRADIRQSLQKLYGEIRGSINHDIVLHIHPTAVKGNDESNVWTFGDGVIYISKSTAASASTEAGKQKLKTEILKAAVRTNRYAVPNVHLMPDASTSETEEPKKTPEEIQPEEKPLESEQSEEPKEPEKPKATAEIDSGFEQTWETGAKKKELSQIFEGYMAARVTGEPQTPGTLEYNQYYFMNALLEKFDIEPYAAAKAYILNRPYHFIQMMQENAWSGSPQNYENQDEIEARFFMCPDQKKIWGTVYKVLDNVQMIHPDIKTREDLEGSVEGLKTYLEQNVKY